MSKEKYSREDASLETLLDLGGEIFPEEILEWNEGDVMGKKY